MTAGYSATELEAVVKHAVSLGALSNFDSKYPAHHSLSQEELLAMLPPLTTQDFRRATSVSAGDVSAYEVWDKKNGSGTWLRKRKSRTRPSMRRNV
ncbi:hypothetical protein RchiOBHm_Chr5g0063531 [Rosa chinensis]|uniref:Uncharacterized protein n=1 Tax=Rosa chinensis TaxID=74649 RepID=A0A2P6QII1_ROSCH|nr:hypothetical protein RchiOBHm_Chr5g0063531 [Rosa chinensis]